MPARPDAATVEGLRQALAIDAVLARISRREGAPTPTSWSGRGGTPAGAHISGSGSVDLT